MTPACASEALPPSFRARCAAWHGQVAGDTPAGDAGRIPVAMTNANDAGCSARRPSRRRSGRSIAQGVAKRRR